MASSLRAAGGLDPLSHPQTPSFLSSLFLRELHLDLLRLYLDLLGLRGLLNRGRLLRGDHLLGRDGLSVSGCFWTVSSFLLLLSGGGLLFFFPFFCCSASISAWIRSLHIPVLQ